MRLAIASSFLFALAGCSAEYVTDSESAPVNAALQSDAGTDIQTTEVAFNLEGAPTCQISVPGMMCEHGCAVTVRQVLSEQAGVKDVKIDFEGKLATVAVDQDVFDAEAAVHLLEDEYGFAETSLKDVETEVDVPAIDVPAEAADEAAG